LLKEPHPPQKIVYPCLDLSRVLDLREPQPQVEIDVFIHAQVGKEQIVLRHVTDEFAEKPIVLAKVHLIDLDRGPLGFEFSQKDLQQGGFTAAAGSHYGHHATLIEGKGNPVQSYGFVPGKLVIDIVDPEFADFDGDLNKVQIAVDQIAEIVEGEDVVVKSKGHPLRHDGPVDENRVGTQRFQPPLLGFADQTEWTIAIPGMDQPMPAIQTLDKELRCSCDLAQGSSASGDQPQNGFTGLESRQAVIEGELFLVSGA